jgi:hypothetical protein
MQSGFLVARFGIETTELLGGVNFVDGPSIKKHFGYLIDLFETDKDPSFRQQFGSHYLESLQVFYIVSFRGV